MKKLFIVTLMVLFAAGTAYAIDYDYSGMIYTRGSYISNSSGMELDKYDYMYYDMEFDSTLKILPSDKSLVYLNWEIHDENWEATPGDSDSKTGDDNIAFKRAFGKYTFDNGWSTSFGLMTGAAFGTSFADNADGRYRWRFDGAGAIGKYGFVLEKNGELGNDGNSGWDGEADDSDAYYGYFVTKAGDVVLQFLGGYVVNGGIGANADLNADGVADIGPGGYVDEGQELTVTLFQAVAMGSFGALGFEAEFDYFNYAWGDSDYEAIGVTLADDYSLFGAYANVWGNIDQWKVGGQVAYGSFDEDSGDGFGFGEDYCPGNFVCDWTGFGTTSMSEYSAVTLFNVYASFAVNEALSFNGSVGYWMSNEKDTIWEDAKGNEINVGMGYKLADNVSYTIAAATGQFDLDGDDPDPFMRAYHKIQIDF